MDCIHFMYVLHPYLTSISEIWMQMSLLNKISCLLLLRKVRCSVSPFDFSAVETNPNYNALKLVKLNLVFGEKLFKC